MGMKKGCENHKVFSLIWGKCIIASNYHTILIANLGGVKGLAVGESKRASCISLGTAWGNRGNILERTGKESECAVRLLVRGLLQ